MTEFPKDPRLWIYLVALKVANTMIRPFESNARSEVHVNKNINETLLESK